MSVKTFQQLPMEFWGRVFELSYSSSLAATCTSICTRIDERIQTFLQKSWQALPLPLNKTLTTIEKLGGEKKEFDSPRKKWRRYNFFFAELHAHLFSQLKNLDCADARMLRHTFRCSLSPERFLLLHQKISHLLCFQEIWPLIQQQTNWCRQTKSPQDVQAFLSSIDERVVAALQRVTYLLIKEKNLSKVPSEIFRMREMTHLDLSKNFLTALPEEISCFQKLEHIDLRGNPLDLTKYEEMLLTLLDLPMLESVDFHEEEFAQLFSQGVKKRHSLMSLARNLTTISPVFADLFENGARPTYSFLRKFFMEDLAAEICRGATLSLRDCDLTLLPEEMFHCLRYVSKLDLSDNPLASIPEEIRLLQALEVLNLEDTVLSFGRYSEITSLLASLPALKYVGHHNKEFLGLFKRAKKEGSKVCAIL